MNTLHEAAVRIGIGVKRAGFVVARKVLLFLACACAAYVMGCEGEGERGGLNQAKVDAAYANGHSIVWLQSDSDFWDVVSVRASGALLGSDAGTYEVAPGHYSLAVTCENDPWKDQWARQHDSSKITQSVGIDLEAGQGAHVLVESTGAGNSFRLTVVSYF